MRLEVANLRYFTKDDFRVLTALEMGMRNHDLVPTELIGAIAGLRHGGVHKVLSHLLQNKLIVHERKLYDGYRLTYPGYDYLALKSLCQKRAITGVGRQIGVGKESDIFIVTNAAGELLVLKLQRLGRTSFRAIKRKRDYLQNRRSANWLYMSRLASLKEFAYMTALRDAGYPTPVPVAHNRHAIVMSLVPGVTLSRVRSLPDPAFTFAECIALLVRLAEGGLVHCDFNQFNIMYVEPAADAAMAAGRFRAAVLGEGDEEGDAEAGAAHASGAALGAAPEPDTKIARGTEATAEADARTAADNALAAASADGSGSPPGRVVMIDFPQMVSTSHPNAAALFDRDVQCIVQCFERRYGYLAPAYPTFGSISRRGPALDVAVEASGHGCSADELSDFEAMMALYRAAVEEEEAASDGEEEDDSADKDASSGATVAAAGPAAPSAVATPAEVGAVTAAGEVFVEVAPEGYDAETGSAAAADCWQMSQSEVDAAVTAAVAAAVEAQRGGGAASGLAAGAEGDGNEGASSRESDSSGSCGNDDDDGEDCEDARYAAAVAAATVAHSLMHERPPEGVRTRPGGQRVRTQRGGEAYLRRGTGASGPSATGGRGGGSSAMTGSISGGAASAQEVRDRVKAGLERARRRDAYAAATAAGGGVAASARHRKKDRDTGKTREVLKEARQDREWE